VIICWNVSVVFVVLSFVILSSTYLLLDVTCCWRFVYCFLYVLKGTPLRSGRVTHLKRFFFENCFLVVDVFIALQSILWYLYMSAIGWQFNQSVDLGKAFKRRFQISGKAPGVYIPLWFTPFRMLRILRMLPKLKTNPILIAVFQWKLLCSKYKTLSKL